MDNKEKVKFCLEMKINNQVFFIGDCLYRQDDNGSLREIGKLPPELTHKIFLGKELVEAIDAELLNLFYKRLGL